MELTATPTIHVVAATPVAQDERISILDSLRGIAILGILLMNIPAFSLPGSGHDPSVFNEKGINFYAWYLVEWLPNGTQRALFSMLFGAGIILFIKGKEKKLTGLLPAEYFIKRQLWLMVFSLFDVYVLLWFGDILFDYACIGIIMFAFRKLPAKGLLAGAAVCFIFMLARENRDLYQRKKMIAKGEQVAALDTTTRKLNLVQKEQLGAMQDLKDRSKQENKLKRAEKMVLKVTGSGYESLYEERTDQYVNSLVRYLYFSVWDVLLFMFIGMAFYKMGILTGNAPTRTYAWMCIIGLGVGLTISYFRIQPLIKNQFNWFEYIKNIKFEYYELSRTFRAIGIFGTIMLMYKSGLFKWLFNLFRPVGQMAFTNYLSQSLICAIFFYGFKMFAKLERYEIYIVVGCIWIIQIIFSHIWMRYYLFGPFEWLWRSLTYWKPQPMRKPGVHENFSIN
jgi:uncharacterized protein